MFSSQALVSLTWGLLALQPALGRPLPQHPQLVPDKRDTRLDIYAHAVDIAIQQDPNTSTTSTTTITTFVTRTTYVSSIARYTSTVWPAHVTPSPPPAPPFAPTQRLSLHQNGQLGYVAKRQIKTVQQDTSTGRPRTTTKIKSTPSSADTGSSITFTIPQIRNPRFDKTDGNNNNQHKNGLRALFHVYAKFSVPVTEDIEKALKSKSFFNSGKGKGKDRLPIPFSPGRSSGSTMWKRGNNTGNVTDSVLAVPPNNFDQEYISPVKIGTPPQTVFLALDTGSADLWTLSPQTPLLRSLSPLGSHALYAPQNSTTSVHVPSQSWRVLYGDGSAAQGTIYLDRVSLSSDLTVPHHPVGVATLVSPQFSADPFLSGILGLGFPRGSAIRPRRIMPTFFENIRASLKEPVFTADLRANYPGKFTFGEISKGSYEGEIGWTDMSKESPYWLFSLRGSQVGNNTRKTYSLSDGKGTASVQTIADTGTSLVMLPRQMVDEYYDNVKGSGYDREWGGMVAPCRGQWSDWSFYVGKEGEKEEYKGTVPGRYINFGPVNGTHCFGGIQSADGFGFAVFGDVLLKSQFVVFDVGNMRIGFAGKKLRT
ncbi:aspartic peptidase domain-containing protein [Cladorrhinum sp. PSN259]|nr:aspartic peptidase domain-containing protein [Cladorrhinum sp. PSN259]